MGIEVKKAKTTEIKKIKELVDETVAANVQLTDMTEEMYKNNLKSGILIVAYKDKELIGVCFGSLNKEYGWASLYGLIVKPEYRKEGVGGMLIKEFEKEANEKGAKTIDSYATKLQVSLFSNLEYQKIEEYSSFRKTLE